LQARHRLRITLTCYSRVSLLRVMPQAVVLALVEVVYSLIVGRTAQARDVAGAWLWNVRQLGELRVARRHVRSFRRVRDAEVRRFQARGFARLTLFLRGQIGRGSDDRLASMARSGRELAGTLQSGTVRASIAVWLAVLVVLVVGSRELLVSGVPAVSEFVPFEGSAVDLVREWASGWRAVGLGSDAAAPTGLALFGVSSLPVGGALGLARTLLIVGLLPLGAFAAHRLALPIGSRRGRLAAVVAYVAIPLPYNAIAAGRWGALATWAVMPLLIARYARAARIEPYALDVSRAPHPLRRHAVVLGVLTALVAMVLPAAPLVVVALGVVLVAGSLVAGRLAGSGRILVVAVGGALVALALHVPWTLDLVDGGSTWASVVGPPDGAPIRPLDEILRFQTGPLGASPIGWAFLGAAALPLFIGRGWRFDWAVRAWAVAITSFGVAWAAQRGSLPVELPDTEVLLAPAAAALALGAALGVTAFEVDLPGYRFGWRQVAAGLAFIALAAGTVPLLGAASDGRWSAPAGDYRRVLASLTDDAEGSFRMLWLGDPDVLPLDSWELEPGLAYATSDDGTPTATNLWAGSDEGATRRLADGLDLAERGETVRLGELLAPMGVGYIVVTTQLAPAPFTDEERPVPAALLDALSQQLDLAEVDVNPALVVYRNLAHVPVRAAVLPGTGDGGDGPNAALAADLAGAEPVLDDPDGFARWRGDLAADRRVLFAASSDDRWQLEVDGERVPRHTVFGWSNAFDVSAGGNGALSFETPASRYVLLGVELFIWLIAIRMLLRMRLGPREEPT
jgi:hypothetical protein